MSIPARIICSSTSGSREDGPMVATILVERMRWQSTPDRAPPPCPSRAPRLSKNGQTPALTKSPLLASGHLRSWLTLGREQALLGAGLWRAGMGETGVAPWSGRVPDRSAWAPSVADPDRRIRGHRGTAFAFLNARGAGRS